MINPENFVVMHSMHHREDDTQSHNRLFGSPGPFVVLSCGEGHPVP